MLPELKAVPFESGSVDFEASTFEGHSAGIGNRDDYDDIIRPGAFDKTIKERVPAGKVKWLDQHATDSTNRLWGRIIEAREVPVPSRDREKHADATHLIWTKFLATKHDPSAQIALGKINEGILDGLSIGFFALNVEFEVDEEADQEMQSDPFWAWLLGLGTRYINELSWWETSSVIWGANAAALVIPGTVKSLTSFAEQIRAGRDMSERDMRQAMFMLGRVFKSARQAEGDLLHVVSFDELGFAIRELDGAITTMQRKNAGGDNREKFRMLHDRFKSRVLEYEPHVGLLLGEKSTPKAPAAPVAPAPAAPVVATEPKNTPDEVVPAWAQGLVDKVNALASRVEELGGGGGGIPPVDSAEPDAGAPKDGPAAPGTGDEPAAVDAPPAQDNAATDDDAGAPSTEDRPDEHVEGDGAEVSTHEDDDIGHEQLALERTRLALIAHELTE